jgi:hypothetical protein
VMLGTCWCKNKARMGINKACLPTGNKPRFVILFDLTSCVKQTSKLKKNDPDLKSNVWGVFWISKIPEDGQHTQTYKDQLDNISLVPRFIASASAGKIM